MATATEPGLRRPAGGDLPPPGPALARLPGYERLKNAGQMGELFVLSLSGIRRPSLWWQTFIDESSLALRRCFIPITLCATFLVMGGAIVYFSNVLITLGTLDRLGLGLAYAWTREESLWITSMVVAGVAGSAIAADLGARKVREEVDALDSLGIDSKRALAVPRVLAMMFVTPLAGLWCLLVGVIGTWFLAPIYFPGRITGAAYMNTYWAGVDFSDIFNLMLKCLLVGALVGTVACFKGLNAKGGAEGVGRAVNEAVLITFVGLWVINELVNLAFLSLFPNASILRG
jgi:phospholipid/cholesterol/gamma-HCH transport system permease protein